MSRKTSRRDESGRSWLRGLPDPHSASLAAEQNQLTAILDSLNALGILEEVQKRPPPGVLCFGPKPVSGLEPAVWSGAVIWYRPPDYHAYKTLFLLGLWAQKSDDGVQILAGTRALPYCGLPFNPESYFFHIRRTFETYYGSDAGPPDDSGRLFARRYDPAARLAMRREIETVLKQWSLAV